MVCVICETRRPRRFCPGVRGSICTLCCGSEREVTVECPLDCEYLQDARIHERTSPVHPDQFPYPEIRVTEDFLRENEELLLFLSRTLLDAALQTPTTVDFDVRETLNALTRTYRTLQSGVYYETRPTNAIAGRVYALVQDAVGELQREERENLALSRITDAAILGVLVFLQRMELDRNNGRKRGRAFLDFLRHFFSHDSETPLSTASSLIVP